LEAIEGAILHIGSLDLCKLIDIKVNPAKRGLDNHAVSTGQWQADFYPLVGTDEHRRIEALYSAGRQLATRYAVVFVKNVSHRLTRPR